MVPPLQLGRTSIAPEEISWARQPARGLPDCLTGQHYRGGVADLGGGDGGDGHSDGYRPPLSRACASARARVNVNVDPLPGLASTQIRPWCASTMPFAM